MLLRKKKHPLTFPSMCFQGKRVDVKAHLHFRMSSWAHKLGGTEVTLRKHDFHCQKSVEIQLKVQL